MKKNTKALIATTMLVGILTPSTVTYGANDIESLEQKVESEIEIGTKEPNEVDLEEKELDINEEDINEQNISEQEDEEETESDEQNNTTSDKIEESEESPVEIQKSSSKYTVGDSGEHVVKLKKNLTLLGFGEFSQNPSPDYDSATSKVVEEFQGYYNLKVTGVVNKSTENKIDNILESPYRVGKRHQDTIQLKKDLNTIGYQVSSTPTNLYGSKTASVVKDFQRDHGLVVNGIADEVTLKKLEELVNQPLKKGMRREDVKVLKQNLAIIGFRVPGNGTSLFGTQTERKVKEFQSYYGLTSDGIVGKSTVDKIDSILESPYRVGKRHQDTIQLKKDLNTIGYQVSSTPTNLYGSKTASVVKDFQRDHGLVANGIADEVTLKKLEELVNQPLKKGMRREDVKVLKQNLAIIGFRVPGNGTSLFGTQTERKVKEFQSYYGLTSDGIVDKSTADKIDSILESPYRVGKRHQDTIQLKKDLNTIGYQVSSTPTNLYGSKTASVVKDFQRDHGLVANGIADEVTLKKLEELVNQPLKKGMRHEDVKVLKQNLAIIGFRVPGNGTSLFGTQTERKVKEFQSYYGLKSDGIVDKSTADKIDSILESPYRVGKRHQDTIQLKIDLDKLGFTVSNTPTALYGSRTESVVKDFQKYYGLVVNGIADSVTLDKMNTIFNSPLRNGERHRDTIQLKKDLEKLGFKISNTPTELYGSKTEEFVREFQEYYGLAVNGIADSVTLAKIAELKKGLNYVKYDYSLEEAVEIQMSQMPQTDKFEYAWVSKNYIDRDGKVTASKLNVRPDPNSSRDPLGTLSKGTKVDIIDEKGNWYAIKYNNSSWVHAVREDLRYYLDPDNFVHDQRQRFQFLDLSKRSGASRSVLNNYLKGKGVLQGQGKAFIDAARAHGVNDIYLISHSILETGHGTSNLASGVRVGKNAAGEPTLVKGGNEKSLTNIKTVYNVYGVGAYDDCPLDCGAVRAYNEGWTTVAKAIKGGAEFIGGDYIKAGQNTIYKMRWNPKMNDGMAWKQYATDIGWASKQVHTMYNLYQEIGFDVPLLDIPEYK